MKTASLNTPFTLEVVYPAVVGVGWNAPVLQLLFDVRMRTCDTVVYRPIHWASYRNYTMDGTILMWIKSYLTNRRQKVKLGNNFLNVFSLPHGVPQDSVLGPLLFTLHTTHLSQIISSFNVTHHLYADDTQIYLALDSRNFDSSIAELT